MAAEDVGGIQAQVTADIQPFLTNLGKAESAAREFDARFGKINVVITATLRMPTQSAIRDYHRDLQREIEKQAPRVAPPPTATTGPAAGAAAAAATPTPIRRTTATATAAQAPAAVVTAAPAAPVVDAAAQAKAQAAAEASRAIAQEKANATGRTVNWTDVGNVTRTVRPERGGGAVGTGAGAGSGVSPVSAGGVARTGTGGFISGPREFAGGIRGASDVNLQSLQEDAAKYRQQQAEEVRTKILRELNKPGMIPRAVVGGKTVDKTVEDILRARRFAEHPSGPFRDLEDLMGASLMTPFQRSLVTGPPPRPSRGGIPAGFGPRFASGNRGVGGTDDFQGMTEEIGRQAAEIERLQGQITQPAAASGRRPLSEAQLAQRAAARANVVQEPGTGLFVNRNVLAARTAGAQPEIQQGAGIEAFAAEAEAATSARAELLALAKSMGGTSTEFLENLGPEAIQRQLNLVKAQQPELFAKFFQEASEELNRAASDEARRLGRTSLGPTPQEREAIIAANPALQESRRVRFAAEESLIGAQAATTVRAPGTFLGGLIAAGAGRTEAAEAQRQARRALTDQERIEKNIVNTEFQRIQTLKDLNREEDPQKKAELVKTYQQQTESLDRYNGSLVTAKENTAALDAEARRTAGSGLRNLAAGFAGGIGASLAFGIGITAITAGVEVVSKALTPFVDRITGYVEQTNRLTASLSDQARAQHGLTDVVVANAFAQSGLGAATADTIRPLIEQRVQIEAGAKATQEQITQIQAAVQLQLQQRRAAAGEAIGPFQPPGGLPGVGAGVGGLFGTPINQQPGLIEQLANVTPRGAGVSSALSGPFAASAVSGGFFGPALGALALLQQTPERAAAQLEQFDLTIQDFNEAAERGDTGARNYTTAIRGANAAQVEASSAILRAEGANEEYIKSLEDIGFALVGPGGAALTGEAGLKAGREYWQNTLKGASRPAAEEALAELRDRVIPARLFQLTAQSQLQRQLIGIQTGVQRAAQPFLPLGTTVPPPGPAGSNVPGGLGAVSPELQGAIGNARQFDTMTVQRIQAARVEIGNLALPGQRAGALASFDRLQGLGQQRADIQTFVTQSQVNLATAQYNEQLRQARLQLGDLAVLTGRVGSAGGDNLGVLEKQNIQYQRANALLQIQLSTLQLELQQRQINFQVAIAGFTAPGVTGAERAARIEQAELEASFAQKQLDIQKDILSNQAQSVPLQIAIQDIQFNRDYQTALNAIDLLTQGRQVNIDVAAAQEAISRIDAQIEEETAKLQTFIQAGAQAAASLIADQAKFIETYTNATFSLQESAASFFTGISSEYADSLIRFLTRVNSHVTNMFGGSRGYTGSTYAGAREGGAQTGFYGTVNDKTQITVGEAGAETIAILRNPRDMVGGFGGGGGGTSVVLNITVTGNNVRSDADLETLSTVVARKVEEAISRRTSLLGFRPS